MPLHLDVLGRLHRVWGAFGVLTGASLGVLALGTDAALADLGLGGAGEPRRCVAAGDCRRLSCAGRRS